MFTLEKVLAPPVTHSGHMVCNKRMAGACKSGLLTYGHNEIQECYCFDDNYDEGGKRCVLVLPVLNARQGIVNQSKCVCVANAVNTEQVQMCDKKRRSMQKWHPMSWWHSRANM